MENSMDNTVHFYPGDPLEGEDVSEGLGMFEAVERGETREGLGMFEAALREEAPESLGVFGTIAAEGFYENAGRPSDMECAMTVAEEPAETAEYPMDPPLGISPPIGTLPPGTPGLPVLPAPPVRPVPPISPLPPVRPVPPIATLPRPPIPAPTPRPPVVIPPAPNPCAQRTIRVTVPFGWDFSDILIRYRISFDALQNANLRVNLGALRAGQILCVPPAGSRGLCSGNASTHIVERSETLAAIARRYRTTVAALLRANPNLAPQDFIPGRVICVPG